MLCMLILSMGGGTFSFIYSWASFHSNFILLSKFSAEENWKRVAENFFLYFVFSLETCEAGIKARALA